MPSALETLVKILKLEQETGYRNTAVIGGLGAFAANWQRDAHQQARRPEHHQLIEELVKLLRAYDGETVPAARAEAIQYMLGRITGRIPAPQVIDAPPTQIPEESGGPEVPADQEMADFTPAEEETLAETAAPPAQASGTPQPAAAPSPPAPAARRRRRESLSPEQAAARLAALQTPVVKLPRVGDKMAEKLGRLGIATVGDLLFTFPRRYNDYSRMRPLNRLLPGETVSIVAEIESIARKQGRGGRPYLHVTLEDGTGVLHAFFFGQLWLQRQFKRGSMVVLSGKVERFRGAPSMTNPEWELLEREHLHTNRIVPVYPLTKGLSARTMRRLMRQALDDYGAAVPDYLPEAVLERTGFPELSWALEQVHFPDTAEHLEQARLRLSFDELFVFQMAVMAARRDWQAVPGQPLTVTDEWLNEALATLPFALTGAQRRALDEIRADLARDIPMNRLLQGDVGSGKTVVAALAMAMAVVNGRQAALMAPTSILAEQHARNVTRLLPAFPGCEHAHIRLLTGNTPPAERQDIYGGLADGSVQVIVGTHALIQEGVTFANLGLAIIDEQHRFGVEQRATLRGKGTNPHLLVMTATPIPRTLALTLYADLDLTLIDEMPPGRSPVETRILWPNERERAYSFIRAQLQKGHQAFIIYPLVESTDPDEVSSAAVDEFERLQRDIFPEFRLGLLHGRLSATEKEDTMAAFARGDIQVLVSTSVVEVGIDVPNATVMLIEHAERFGLAQLHQFRGRVGRGEHRSFCLLLTESPSDEATERLRALEETTDGFRLAEIDWKLRGAGDLLGVRQSGIGQFRLAELMNPHLVELAQREARTVYADDPSLARPEHFLLARRIAALAERRGDIS
jgi:ATP-dependent DNA helicase RecG